MLKLWALGHVIGWHLNSLWHCLEFFFFKWLGFGVTNVSSCMRKVQAKLEVSKDRATKWAWEKSYKKSTTFWFRAKMVSFCSAKWVYHLCLSSFNKEVVRVVALKHWKWCTIMIMHNMWNKLGCPFVFFLNLLVWVLLMSFVWFCWFLELWCDVCHWCVWRLLVITDNFLRQVWCKLSPLSNSS